jgi:competence protein ComEA
VTELKQRLALLIISALIITALYFSGREPDHTVRQAAFLHYSSGTTIVRLQGCIPKPGVYGFRKNANLATVINMTAPSITGKISDKRLLNRVLENGDIVAAVARDSQHIDITITKMKARERILLGIPLVADELDQADWENMPGIGPVLAKRIMDNRQKYGDFGVIDSLLRVPGIGEKRVKAIKIYFRTP